MTSVFVGATYYDYTEDLEYVALPFPSPNNFDSDVCGALLFWESTAKRYEYYIYQVNYSNPEGNKGITYTRDGVTLTFNGVAGGTIFNGSDVVVTYDIIRMWYYPSQSTYSYFSFEGSLPSNNTYSYVNNTVVSADATSFAWYGDFVLGDSSTIHNNKTSYVFNNDISPYVFKQMSSDLGEIKLYCADILEALGEGSDYVPPESTTNEVIDGYHQAEQDLMNNQFDNIDSVVDVLPTFNADVVNGTSTGNSFLFVSDLMNFLTGNGSGYGTSINSMGKIASAVYIILSLGFASFIIGLVNRRKE